MTVNQTPFKVFVAVNITNSFMICAAVYSGAQVLTFRRNLWSLSTG